MADAPGGVPYPPQALDAAAEALRDELPRLISEYTAPVQTAGQLRQVIASAASRVLAAAERARDGDAGHDARIRADERQRIIALAEQHAAQCYGLCTDPDCGIHLVGTGHHHHLRSFADLLRAEGDADAGA